MLHYEEIKYGQYTILNQYDELKFSSFVMKTNGGCCKNSNLFLI